MSGGADMVAESRSTKKRGPSTQQTAGTVPGGVNRIEEFAGKVKNPAGPMLVGAVVSE